jgi:DUF971 family protein
MALPRTLTPKRIKAPHGAKIFEITWADGETSVLPHEILRGYCPCATCQGHSGTIKYVPGGNLELRTIERVGNYALSLGWGDGHDSGIYTFDYLRKLGERLATEGVEALTRQDEEKDAEPH